jgi:hypothetical protein
MARFVRMGKMISLAVALGFGAATAGCGGDYSEPVDGSSESDEAVDEMVSDEAETLGAESGELGTAQQELFFFNPFNFTSSCTDSKGTNSVMAALAVATATELKRWQPTKDFVSSGGMLKLTATGKAQCADGVCWNTQAILDLQKAAVRTVQIRPGVMLDTAALKSALSSNLIAQVLNILRLIVPDHKFELMYSESGGCDQFYWFNVKTPSGGAVSSLLMSTLQKNLTWVGGSGNPYIQFQTNGTTVGIDPTYGLNDAGSTSSGSCVAACTKMSAGNLTGSCCSCNGTKKFARSAWSTTTYLCQ